MSEKRMYVLDTNVISELSRERPHPSVVDFLAEWDDLWLSVIVIEELEMGVQLLPEGRRRERLRDWLSRLLTDFDRRILPIERREAEWAAAFQARAHRGGGMLQLADALIAGTAKTNNLAVATRNVKDFASLDIDIVSPWQSP